MCAILLIKPQRENTRINHVTTSLSPSAESAKSEKDQTSVKYVRPRNNAVQMTMALFTNGRFVLMTVSCAVFLFGVAVMYTHLMAFAKTQGISSALRSLLVSLLGLSSLIGRIALGLLSQHPYINTIVLYIITVLISGKQVLQHPFKSRT